MKLPLSLWIYLVAGRCMSFNQQHHHFVFWERRGGNLISLKHFMALKNEIKRPTKGKKPKTKLPQTHKTTNQEYFTILCPIIITFFPLGKSRFLSFFLNTNRYYLNGTICGPSAYNYLSLLMWFGYFFK